MPTLPSHGSSHRMLRLATYASVATATLLILVKLTAWLLTGSVSILASLADSLMDACASLLNLMMVRYALKPADAEHRFGHGKAESLAGLGQAAFIAGSALFLILNAIDRLLHPQPIQTIALGIGVMLFAIAVTGLLLLLQHYVIRQTASTAIRADALHYAGDILTNTAVIVALILAAFGWPGLDPVFALAIAGYILYSAWRIAYDAVAILMDRELPEAEQQQILAIASNHPKVRGVHGLRSRRSGQTPIIQLHLEIDGHLTLTTAHAILMEVDAALHAAFPQADILIHQDPWDNTKNPVKQSAPDIRDAKA